MFRRLLSILLIFTVNILFLGHAVIPHHHHDGIPHFILFEKDHTGFAGDSDCCCSHNIPKECEDSCQLEKDIDVILETEKDYHSLVCCDSHDHSDLLFQAVLLYYSFDLAGFESDDPYRIPPYLISYSSVHVNQIHGLRAPPMA